MKAIVFGIYGKDIADFCRVMNYVSAISVDATTEGICISVTVPNVFVHKDEVNDPATPESSI